MSWITSENGLRAILGKNVYNKFKAVFDACCGGISTEGDPTKFLNQKGEFATITSNSTKSSTQLLGSLIGADFNTTVDQTITLSGGNTFIVTDIIITNASVNMNTAEGITINDGLNIIANFGSTGLGWILTTVLATPSHFVNNNYAIAAGHPLFGSTLNINSNNLTLSIATPQGSAATADIYIFGFILQ